MIFIFLDVNLINLVSFMDYNPKNIIMFYSKAIVPI